MEKLCCDVCGGTLEMQGNGTAVCEFCGMKYSLASLRSKAQEIYGTVKVEGSIQTRQTGTQEDIAQWHTLLDRYLAAFDYEAAKSVAKKILEADPSDEKAGEAYENIQSCWRYLEIKNGVLEKYTGRCNSVCIPNGITKIGDGAFDLSHAETGSIESLYEVILPDSVVAIGTDAFAQCHALKKIMFGNNLIKIGVRAFQLCAALQEIVLPDTVVNIGEYAFSGCKSLSKISLPPKVKTLEKGTFRGCKNLITVSLQDGLEYANLSAFFGCEKLENLHFPESLKALSYETFGFDDGYYSYGLKALNSIYIPNSTIITNDNGSDVEFSVYTHNHALEELRKIFRDSKALTNVQAPKIIFGATPIGQQSWRNANRCQYCGGEFKGVFNKVCSRCGEHKNY